MNIKIFTLLGIAMALLSNGLKSQTINTDRPDQTESSATVPNKSLQIESGVLIGFTEEPGLSTRQILAPTSLLRFALFNFAELRFVSQIEHFRNYNKGMDRLGLSDLELGTKIQLFQKEGVGFEAAVLSHWVIPSGSTFLSNGMNGTVNKICLSHAISNNLGIGYNIGYNYFGIGDGDLTYSIALGYSINDRVGVYIEPYGEYSNLKTYVSNFDAGFTYLIYEQLQADFSFGVGLNNKMNYASLGISWLLLRNNKDN